MTAPSSILLSPVSSVMRWNEFEVASLSHQPPEWEGKLLHKPPPKMSSSVVPSFAKSSDEYKERWFRLRANCLFYWRITDARGGALPVSAEPLGVLMLEDSHAQQEGFAAESVNAFSIIFGVDGGGRKHMFLADSARRVQQWLSALKRAKYETMRKKLIGLQIKICNKTGRDPLVGTGFYLNPIYNAKLATSNGAVAALAAAEESPKPKPRKSKTSSANKNTFQSHVTENWEAHSARGDQAQELEVDAASSSRSNKKASFRSHVDVSKGALIDFS